MSRSKPSAFLKRVYERAAGNIDIRHALVLADEIECASSGTYEEAREAWRREVAMAFIAIKQEEARQR